MCPICTNMHQFNASQDQPASNTKKKLNTAKNQQVVMQSFQYA